MADQPIDNPFLETLGVQLAQWRDGYAEMVMPIDASKLNRQGVLQGGAIATLMDAAAGYAGCYSPPGEPPRHGFTLSLTTNYLDKGLGEFVRAKGFLERAGRSIFFSRAEAWIDDRLLIASAQGTFKYTRTRGKRRRGLVRPYAAQVDGRRAPDYDWRPRAARGPV